MSIQANGKKKEKEHDHDWSAMSVNSEKQSLLCGLLNCRPQWLQRFNTARWFFAFFCLAFLVHHMTNTMVSVNLSTIEKRFHLSSTRSSFITNAYDISCAATVMIISHFCRNHKPKWIGIGMILMGIGAMIFCLPHVAETITITDDGLAGVVATGLAGSELALCKTGGGIEIECVDGGDVSNSQWYFIFLIGALLLGIGGTPLQALGPPFLDEIFPPTHVGVYYGIMGSMSCLGPIFGFFFGGYMLSYYVDFSVPENMDPTHPNWIGAWWVGFIVSGVVAVVTAIPLICYPRKLPESDTIFSMKVAQGLASPELSNDNERTENLTAMEMAKEFVPDLKALLTNGAYMCCTLSQAFTGFLIGACTFLPKLVQIGLRFTPTQASFYLGTVLVSAAGGGYLIGGVMVKKLKMNGKSAAKYALIFSLMGLVPSFGMLMHCPGVELGGGGVSVDESSLVMDTLSSASYSTSSKDSCSEVCDCPEQNYNPVCGGDETFFSPCHAGCTSKELIDGKYVFGNCSCLLGGEFSMSANVTNGKCDAPCASYTAFIYLGSAFLSLFFGFLSTPASMLALNRSVAPEHLSLAYGIRNLLFRTIGTIPGPIMYGIVIDSACTVWQRGCDGGYGSCWEYNTTQLVYSVTAAFIAVKILSDVFIFLAWRLYPESGSFSHSGSASKTISRSNTEDHLSEFIVTATNDKDIMSVQYRDASSSEQEGSQTRRLSELIKQGLEKGKVFVAMAHETIV